MTGDLAPGERFVNAIYSDLRVFSRWLRAGLGKGRFLYAEPHTRERRESFILREVHGNSSLSDINRRVRMRMGLMGGRIALQWRDLNCEFFNDYNTEMMLPRWL